MLRRLNYKKKNTLLDHFHNDKIPKCLKRLIIVHLAADNQSSKFTAKVSVCVV